MRSALERLDARTTRVGVVAYAGDAADAGTRGAELIVALTENYDEVRSVLEKLGKRGPRGMTDRRAGIDLAAEHLARASGRPAGSSARRALVLLALFLLQSSRCAAEIYELLLLFADRNALCAASYCTGSVSRYLGQLAMMLGKDAVAASHFDTAIARNLKMEAAPFVAMARHEYALLLGRQGHRSAAARRRALARAALATARKLGMQHLEQRVRALDVYG